jgi:hypothetical protein
MAEELGIGGIRTLGALTRLPARALGIKRLQ